MAYIGTEPIVGQYRKLDDISGSFNGSTTTFNLTVTTAPVTAGTAQQLLVSLGGVIQNPNIDYTVSTNTITFTTAPASGLSFFGVLMGDTLNVGTPSDGTVTSAKLASDLTIDLASGTVSAPSLSFDSNTGFYSTADNEVAITTDGTYRAKVDSSGRLLVGTSTARANYFNSTLSAALQIEGTGHDSSSVTITRNSNDGSAPTISLAKSRGTATGSNTVVQSGDDLGYLAFQGSDGSEFVGGAYIYATVDGTPGANDLPTRLSFSTTADGASSPTERMRIDSSGVVKFSTQAVQIGGGTNQNIFRSGADGSGIHFTTNGIIPTNETGNISDNTETWGNSGYRWSVIYAATGTINTSDANEKQDIQDLSAAELAVAKELKSLIKTFRWKQAVAEKGDSARTHVGVIAQDVQQLFADHGLDVTKYGLWCSDTWYEVDGIGVDTNGIPYKADSEGAIARTRLGIRYDELLAFVLAAL